MISHIIIWRIIDERKAVYTLVVTAGQTTSFKRADEEQTGAITIYKEGEVLTGWDGTNFVYEVRKLPGATFRVVAAEDIYRADGALVYHKGDIVADNLTTGKDGQVVVNILSHVVEGVEFVLRRGLILLAVQEGHHMGPGAAQLGAEGSVGGADGDAPLHGPQHRLVIVA